MNANQTTLVPAKLSALEKHLFGTNVGQVHCLLPGLLLAILIAWGSIWLGQWLGCDILCFDKTPISAVTIAILLGIVINNVLPLCFGVLRVAYSVRGRASNVKRQMQSMR